MQDFQAALEIYAKHAVDVERALEQLTQTPVSLQCWQGDDVGGFERPGATLGGGGIQVTGNYPGKARSLPELRADLAFVLTLVPGRHRLNLHASYLDNDGTFIERDAVEPVHFESWVGWARDQELHGIDFNPTCYSHPKADGGLTLAHPDPAIRSFWVDHCRASRRIAAYLGECFGTPAVNNLWIPDGTKDTPADRLAPRERLLDSLDRVLEERFDAAHMLDAVESKLFGVGVESYSVGSHEFYLAYAVARQLLLCLDTGHFHPTETVIDKLSAVRPFVPGILLHVSRGVRWDSDHVVTLTDELCGLMGELVRGRLLDRTHIGMDFFDATINRVAAYVIGLRNVQKALLIALLEPPAAAEAEAGGDLTGRLAAMECAKTLPWGAVWSEFCRREDVPDDAAWLGEVQCYEREVLRLRA